MGRLLSSAQEIIGEKIFKHLAKFMGDVKFNRTITAYSPVASEPSVGSLHLHFEVLVDYADPTTTNDITVSVPNVPVGTKAIIGQVVMRSLSTALRSISIKGKDDGNGYASTRNYIISTYGYNMFIVPLNSNREFVYEVSNTDVDAVYIYMTGYFI